MKVLAITLGAVALLVAGGAVGALARGPETRTETVTAVQTVHEESLLPPPVERTRRAIAAAAKAHDLAALRKLIPDDGFTYSYGGPYKGGPIAYWRHLEATTSDEPFGVLARILQLPYTVNAGHFVWPFAYDKKLDELGDYGRGLLGDLSVTYVGDSYYGWRAGIEPDGTWRFYVRGD